MKTIRVVAAIICDDMEKPGGRFLRQPEDTENSKGSGSFRAVRLKKGNRRRMRLSEKSGKN